MNLFNKCYPHAIFLVYFITLASIIFSSSYAVYAQDQTDTTQSAPAPLPVETFDIVSGNIPIARHNIEDRAKLEAWLDGVIESYKKKDDIAGITLAIVKSGYSLTERSYGISTPDTLDPVNSRETLFRIGSISKTFIWISLMQLHETNKISLDDPIDKYLPETLKTNGGSFAPIRIKHLMAHTAGFEDRALGHLFESDVNDVASLANYLETYKPARVREPGSQVSYSNYGAGLAAMIVEKVSGEGFYDYVEAHITSPLFMENTTFREPTPDERIDLPRPIDPILQENNSVAMERVQDQWQEGSYFYITQVGPAGSMVTSAYDMAQYMRMLLLKGSLYDGFVMNPATHSLMMETLHTIQDGGPRIAHGFMSYNLPAEYKGYGHGGNTIYFHSNMVIIPELDIGVFISTNGPNGHKLANALPKLLVKRYYGTETSPLTPSLDFIKRSQGLAGNYMNNRRSYTGLDMLFALGSVTSVSITDDGYLLTTSGAKTRRWVEIAPLLFQAHDGDDRLAFHQNEAGVITRMSHPMGIMEYEKIGYYDNPSWFYLISLLGIFTAWITIVTAWSRRKTIKYLSLVEFGTIGAAPIAAILWVLFSISLLVAGLEIQNLGNHIISVFPTGMLVTALNIAVIATLFTLISLVTLPIIWKLQDWSVVRKIRHSSLIIIWVLMVFTFNDWNMIGHHYY